MSANLSKLTQVRALMSANKIDAFIVPTADAHISEYVSDHDKRRGYISEFHGSAGTALITQTNAFLWTDGRYFLQAIKELPEHWTLMKQGVQDVPTIEQWCVKNLSGGQVVGFDPFLLQLSQFKTFTEAFEEAKVEFRPVVGNYIDQVWTEQPPMSRGEIRSHDIRFAGQSAEDKIALVQKKMVDNKAFALVLCALDEIAWLLNLRGCDISFNPVFLSYVIITNDKVHFFVDRSKVKEGIEFDEKVYEIHPYDEVTSFMASLKNIAIEKKQKIWIDAVKSNYAVYNAVGFTDAADVKNYIIQGANPVTLMKAIKNEAEIEGMKQAHIRDGAALSKFLAFFASQFDTLPSVTSGEEAIKQSPWNEFTIAEKLEQTRRETSGFVGLSFDSISSVGPNGAIIHYKPDETTSAPVTSGNVYLLDSGAQLLDGTTDVTRTFYIPSPDRPTPTDFQKDAFTRVLQGHIALANIKFPPQTMGPSIDVLARAALWAVGLDYQHGTGHGVGAHINVHEGPIGIAKMNRGGAMCTTPLVQGMVLSNEPGYYHDGEFGIRIENLVHIVPKETKYTKKGWLGFEDLTMVPIDRSLIIKENLNQIEIDWVNDYHATVRKNITQLVADDEVAAKWVKENTEPL